MIRTAETPCEPFIKGPLPSFTFSLFSRSSPLRVRTRSLRNALVLSCLYLLIFNNGKKEVQNDSTRSSRHPEPLSLNHGHRLSPQGDPNPTSSSGKSGLSEPTTPTEAHLQRNSLHRAEIRLAPRERRRPHDLGQESVENSPRPLRCSLHAVTRLRRPRRPSQGRRATTMGRRPLSTHP